MHRQALSLRTGLVLLLLSAGAPLLRAQPDPGDVAHECIERLRAMSNDCAARLLRLGERSAHRIDALQAEGHDFLARLLAHAALARVGHITRDCLVRMERLTRDCLRLLEALHAPDPLKQAVREAFAHARQRVLHASAAARRMIRHALND